MYDLLRITFNLININCKIYLYYIYLIFIIIRVYICGMCNYLNIYNFETCLDDKTRKKAANMGKMDKQLIIMCYNYVNMLSSR